ncbi:hypothetical protein Shyd_46280 [Streptomyces hydrogenans]|uniref:Uncharacterized protein n=1 Tax=Streptomyces hydrogenans TaxID=1873719 RepID=A0ABQ3PDZ7_9ACTN|nr:hypothetical protein Shyd_46280 [Streptomyces hydrogenans]
MGAAAGAGAAWAGAAAPTAATAAAPAAAPPKARRDRGEDMADLQGGVRVCLRARRAGDGAADGAGRRGKKGRAFRRGDSRRS